MTNRKWLASFCQNQGAKGFSIVRSLNLASRAPALTCFHALDAPSVILTFHCAQDKRNIPNQQWQKTLLTRFMS